MHKFKFLGAVMMLGLMLATTASAAEFIPAGDQMQSSVSTREEDVHKNLYIAGASVTVNGKTLGDLAAAGGVVTLNGDVEKGLLLAGGNLTVNGSVGENARIAGGNISISGPVSGDLVVGGGNITVAQKANVGGDLVVGGGNITLDSDVAGNVKIGGGAVTINGKISGNVEIMASKSLTFGPTSEVLGKIIYKGAQPAVVSAGAIVGVIDYTQIQNRAAAQNHGFFGFMFITSLLKLLMLLVAGLVLCWLLPAKTSAVVHQAISSPLHNLGVGALVLIISPILGIVLMVTVVGLYLGLVVLLIYGLFLILSSILALFYVGRLVWGWYQKDAPANQWRDLGVGALVTLLVGLIPIIGWLALAVVWVITLGALKTQWHKDMTQG